MDTTTSVVLSSAAADEFVELSSPHLKVRGRLFKKEILPWGEFSHPRNPKFKVNVDQDFYRQLKQNFDNKVCPIVQVPMVDDQNRHVESPERNIGQVVDLGSDSHGIYAYIDVRKNADDVGQTLLGASAKMSLNHLDRTTNQYVGPALYHVAVTNRPYLTNLSDFEEVAMSDDTEEEAELLVNGVSETQSISKEEIPMVTKDEAITALSEYGIDVNAGQAALQELQGFVDLSNVIEVDAVTPEAVSSAIVDLSNSINERDQQIETLTTQLNEVNLSKAQAEVEKYIEEGRILPAMKDDMVDLSLTDRDRFERFLLPEDFARVEMSEQGVTTSEDTHQNDPEDAAKAEGARLATLAQGRN